MSTTSTIDTTSTMCLRMALFLLDQFVLCMHGRSERVRRQAMQRLSYLGQPVDLSVHLEVVGKVKTEQISAFVDSFLSFVPFLSQVPAGMQEAVSYAIMDVYMLATGPKTLGSLLAELALAKTDTEKDTLLSNASVSVEQFTQLMAVVPHIAYFRTGGIGLWCMEPRGNAGRPSDKLRQDVEKISVLGDYLPDHQLKRFAASLALARRSMALREASPLRLERIGRWDVAAAYVEDAILVEAACESTLIAPVQEETSEQTEDDGGVTQHDVASSEELGIEPG